MGWTIGVNVELIGIHGWAIEWAYSQTPKHPHKTLKLGSKSTPGKISILEQYMVVYH